LFAKDLSMKALLIAAAILLSAPSLAFAQPQADQTPKPGPEVQKLDYYVGTWEGHGETKAGPFGEAGKLSSKMTCDWFAGGFQIVCKGEETGPSGKRGFLNLLAYDEKAKAYTQYSISSFGETEYDQGGSLVGDKLTYLLDQDAGGKPAKFRYIEEHLSPVLMTYQAEVSVEGQPWMVLAEGKIAKVK
jgi:hypothetical protein